MDTLFPETPSDMLYSFMDGELEIAKENILFDELARNGELRAEMRDLLAIRAEVQKDDEAFVPPVTTTAALFTTLGITAPLAPAIPSAVVPAGNFLSQMGEKISSIFAQSWLPVLTASLAAVATYFFVSNVTEEKFSSMQKNYSAKIQERDEKISLLEKENFALNNSQKNLIAERNNIQQRDGDFTKFLKENFTRLEKIFTASNNSSGKNSSFTENSQNEKKNFIADNDNFSTAPDIQRSVMPLQNFEEENFLSQNNSFTTPQRIFPSVSNSAPHFASHDYGLNFQFRSIAGRSFPSPSLGFEEGYLNNFAVRISYPFWKNISLGLEGGKENFALAYEGEENGAFISYMKSANLGWGGVSAQYDIAEIYPEIFFFGRAFGGFSEVGLLGKTMLGFEYQPIPSLGLMLGGEFSHARYSHQGKNYSTNKLGISYGINYLF